MQLPIGWFLGEFVVGRRHGLLWDAGLASSLGECPLKKFCLSVSFPCMRDRAAELSGASLAGGENSFFYSPPILYAHVCAAGMR